ncbi:MAG: hypothetical protein JEZ12_14950 [Desulfobacterium sp.]|nr:hypothetical protein [Desulfobacterium sp.]
MPVRFLFRLAGYTAQERYADRGRRALKAFSNILSSNPATLSEMLLAVDHFLSTPEETNTL